MTTDKLLGGSAMNITDIKIRKIFTEGKVRAVVSIILDGDFAVHDLKVIEGVERLFVAMPNRRSEDGRFQDIVHPISTEARTQLEAVVLQKYKEAVEAAEDRSEEL
jgi:stage V sporulation protein G